MAEAGRLIGQSGDDGQIKKSGGLSMAYAGAISLALSSFIAFYHYSADALDFGRDPLIICMAAGSVCAAIPVAVMRIALKGAQLPRKAFVAFAASGIAFEALAFVLRLANMSWPAAAFIAAAMTGGGFVFVLAAWLGVFDGLGTKRLIFFLTTVLLFTALATWIQLALREPMRQHVAFVFVSLSALVCIVSLLRTTARREESNVADSERPPLRIKPLLPLTLFCLVAGVLCEAMFRIDMASDALPFPFYLFICINFLVAHGIAVVRIAGWPRLILHTVCPAAALLLAVVLGSVLRLLGLHAILAATADVTLLTTTYFCIIVFAKSRAYSVVLSVCFANSGMHLGVAACSMAMPSIAEALKVLEVQAGILYAISTMFMLLLFVVFHSFTQRSLGRERFQAALATLRAEQEPDDGRQEFDAYFIWHLMGEGLTEHQAKIANYIATGHSHLQVAERFVISQHTVRNHSVNICDKLLLHGAKDLMDLYHATTGFSYFVSGSNTVSLDTMPFEPRSRNKKTKAKKKA